MVELIVAAMVFSVVSLGFAGLHIYQYKAIGKARSLLLAKFYAQHVMEACVAARYSNVDLFVSAPPPPFDAVLRIRDQVQTKVYSSTVTVGMIDATDVATYGLDAELIGTKFVNVTVSWDEGEATPRTIEYQTYLTENG